MTTKTAKDTYFYISDHLGSASIVLDADGNISQSVNYIPYGEVFVEERSGAWNSPYLFNAKELDPETGFYYYGARYLNPTSAVWLSVDPLFEKNIDASPYSYCHGNPINKIDVMGLDDYGVDDNGYIFFIKKTESEMDRLIAGISRKKDGEIKGLKYNKNGELKNESIDVTKRVLRECTKDNRDKNGGHILRLKDTNEAKTLFEFMAKSTEVEWSFFDLIHTENNITMTSLILSTSHSWDSELAGPTYLYNMIKGDNGFKSTFHIHNHPNIHSVPFESGISPSDKDINMANVLTNTFGGKNMEFKIFLYNGERSEYKKFK